MKRILLTLLLCNLLLVADASAQQTSRADAGVTVSASRRLGYENPNLGASGRLLLGLAPRFSLEGRFDAIFRAHKVVGGGSEPNGHGFIGKADLHGFVRRDVSLVGGLSVYRQVTDQFKATDAGPAVGAAYWGRNYRLQALYEPSIRSGNHDPSAFVFSGEAILPRRGYYFAVRPELNITRFTQAGLGKLTGFRAGFSFSIGTFLED